MARDRDQFKKALRIRQALIDDGHVSAPNHEGKHVIAVPYNADQVSSYESFERFSKHASKLAGHILKQTGSQPELALNASRSDIISIYTNPQISSVTVIGRGTLSAIGSQDGAITWYDVAQHVDHLKQGETRQLMCGWQPNVLNVPFGTFGVSDASNLLALPGTYIAGAASPIKLYETLRPVFEHNNEIDYRHIKDTFPQMTSYEGLNKVRQLGDRAIHHALSGTLLPAAKSYIRKTLAARTQS